MKPARFTLIELLMVICIILILASLMLSALGKANRKAKFAICFNNSKQMALGTMIYTQINRGALPPASNTFWGKKGISWDDYISPLMGINLTQEQQEYNGIKLSMKIPGGKSLLCPLAKDKTSTNVQEIDYESGSSSNYSVNSSSDPFEGRSYVMNGQQDTDPRRESLGIGNERGQSCSLAIIRKSPSQVCVITERYTKARGAGDASNSGYIDTGYGNAPGLHTDKLGFYVTTLADGGTAFLSKRVLEAYQFKW